MLLTKPLYADLMRKMRGIDEVLQPAAAGTADLPRIAGEIRRRRFQNILDAHNVLRSHLVTGLLARRPDRRLAKDTVARLRLLRSGRSHPSLQQNMTDRFGKVLGRPVPLDCPPPLDLVETPDDSMVLGVAPGAMWNTKRWPEERFSAICRRFLSSTDAGLRIFLGPREEAWFPMSDLSSLETMERVSVIRSRPLLEVASALAGCRLLLTNDSGLLHLAEATGTPVLAFFGPTVREFGYFPRLPASGVLESDLACRPCSRNGKRPCHRGDLACLREIGEEEALDALHRQWTAATPGSGS